MSLSDEYEEVLAAQTDEDRENEELQEILSIARRSERHRSYI